MQTPPVSPARCANVSGHSAHAGSRKACSVRVQLATECCVMRRPEHALQDGHGATFGCTYGSSSKAGVGLLAALADTEVKGNSMIESA